MAYLADALTTAQYDPRYRVEPGDLILLMVWPARHVHRCLYLAGFQRWLNQHLFRFSG